LPKRKSGLVCGVGVNDVDIQISCQVNGKQVVCKIYFAWASLLQRTLTENGRKKKRRYRGSTICPEWILFSNFRSWVVCQDWEGKELDKDILVPGNKYYSPETCCFVDRKINGLLAYKHSTNSSLPIGVAFSEKSGKYTSKISIDGKATHIGSFSSMNDAADSYITAKSEEIRRHGRMQTDPRIMIGLFRHAHALEQTLA